VDGAAAGAAGADAAGGADASGAGAEASGAAAGGGVSSVFWQAEAKNRATKAIIINLRIISSSNGSGNWR